MKNQITFLLTGLIMGLVCVIPGISLLMFFTLTWGVGPCFFLAVVVGIVITGARRHVQAGFLRYFAALIVCIITYLLALMAFFGVTGFSPSWFGIRESDDIVQFGIDVWLGLIAAGAVGAIGIAVFTALLTRKWSNSHLLRLMLAGLLTILVTFIVNLPFHSYWSFLGVLLPLGNGLFSYVVGNELLQYSEEAGQVPATSPTA